VIASDHASARRSRRSAPGAWIGGRLVDQRQRSARPQRTRCHGRRSHRPDPGCDPSSSRLAAGRPCGHRGHLAVVRLARRAGHLDGSTIGTLRRIAAALDAGARFDVRWRGGLADRLLDERHAALGVTVATRLQALGWTVIPEVTFQRFGERGSIDLLGYRDDRRAVGIIEHKSVVHSFEETQRRLDVKARLANQIAERRLGWRPRIVGVVLAIEDTTSNRARLAPIQPLLRAGLPASPREVRAWLADPTESLRGTWFVTIRGGHPKRRLGRARVRIPRDRGRAKPNVGRESGQPRS
jgi:hypothetical protein